MPIDQLPRIADLLAPGVTALIAARPSAERHTTSRTGRYAAVIRGLGAQAELARAYLASEVKAGTLQAEGAALLEYLQSEFFASFDQTALAGVGHADITRTITNAVAETNSLTPGVLRKGTIISRPGDPGFTPVVEQAEYETLEDASFGPNDTTTTGSGESVTHVQTVTSVPIRALRTGTHSSVPVFLEAVTPHQAGRVSSGDLFETQSTWSASLRCGGGAAELVDDQLRQIAPYLGQGLFGPTGAAGMAGALGYLGVRYAAYRSNQTSGVDQVFVADGAWGSSPAFSEAVIGFMAAKRWIGFGARIRAREVENQPTIVRPTVMVQNTEKTGDKTALREDLLAAARKYFDERPNWWTWSTESLRAALTAGSRKILTVTDVDVTDRSGTALEPPAAALSEDSLPVHHYLVGLEPTFTTPS